MSGVRAMLCAALLVVLCGCAPFAQQDAQRYFVLEAALPQPGSSNPSRPGTLLVAPTSASGFYDTPEIVYSRAPGERSYYQLSGWTQRPARRITELLTMRLERSGAFATVATTHSGVQGALILETRLTEFYHDAATAPGAVRVTLAAELVDAQRRTLLARRTFDRTAPATSYDAAGAVQAFGRAVTAILDDVAAWVDKAAPR